MKIITRKYQAGGPMPAPQEPMAPQGGDPLMEIAQVASQALQEQNCEAALAVCEAFLMLLQESQAPAPEQPVFKKGGKIKESEKKSRGGMVFNKRKDKK